MFRYDCTEIVKIVQLVIKKTKFDTLFNEFELTICSWKQCPQTPFFVLCRPDLWSLDDRYLALHHTKEYDLQIHQSHWCFLETKELFQRREIKLNHFIYQWYNVRECDSTYLSLYYECGVCLWSPCIASSLLVDPNFSWPRPRSCSPFEWRIHIDFRIESMFEIRSSAGSPSSLWTRSECRPVRHISLSARIWRKLLNLGLDFPLCSCYSLYVWDWPPVDLKCLIFR